MITVYGIRNCDTVKRARARLEAEGIDFRFHDFKRDGLAPGLAQSWIDRLGIEPVLNRRGTTWRKLDEATQAALQGPAAADALAQHSSVIKRPVFDRDGELRIGFARGDESELLDWLRG